MQRSDCPALSTMDPSGKSSIPRVTLLAPVGAGACYCTYLSQLAIHKVAQTASPRAFAEGMQMSQEGVGFISQAYMEEVGAWDKIHPMVYDARCKYAPIFALLESDCQPILLARAFDYGFNEVVKLDQPEHEANARMRSACRSSSEARMLAQSRGIDSETDFYLDSVFDSHLAAARGYAMRHQTGVYGIVLKLIFMDGCPDEFSPKKLHREMLQFASSLKTIARPYDPIFRLDTYRFLILTFDMLEQHLVAAVRRINSMVIGQTKLDGIGAKIENEVYHFPVDSDLSIRDIVPTPLA